MNAVHSERLQIYRYLALPTVTEDTIQFIPIIELTLVYSHTLTCICAKYNTFCVKNCVIVIFGIFSWKKKGNFVIYVCKFTDCSL